MFDSAQTKILFKLKIEKQIPKRRIRPAGRIEAAAAGFQRL
jgi:hypothetical protein